MERCVQPGQGAGRSHQGILLEWVEAEGLQVAAGRFPGASFGHITREDGVHRQWRPLGEEGAGSATASQTKKEKTYESNVG